jgi:peptidoglycan-associated lipoprotein
MTIRRGPRHENRKAEVRDDSHLKKENTRMSRRTGGLVLGIVMTALIGFVALGGCSKKNVASTSETEGTESSKAGAGGKGDGGQDATARRGDGSGGGQGGGEGAPRGDGGAGGSDPLKGFGKGSGEESVKSSSTMTAQANQAEIDARRAREAAMRDLKDVYFAYDKWALSKEGQKNLAETAEFLKQNPTTRVVIEGHCDERGSREYNLVLGEKRAKEVRRYLTDLGIKNPMSITSYGKERPVCTEHDESCYWRNRRAHVAAEAGQ